MAVTLASGPSLLHADTASDLESSGCSDFHPTNFVVQAKCLDEWNELSEEFAQLHYAEDHYVEFWGLQITDGSATSSENAVAATIYNTCKGQTFSWLRTTRDKSGQASDPSVKGLYELAKEWRSVVLDIL